jgi:hypothetical protein
MDKLTQANILEKILKRKFKQRLKISLNQIPHTSYSISS